MLTRIADGVLVHESECIQSNAVIVEGHDGGVLLIDAGITGAEMAALARDLHSSGRTVMAGFSTHPDWDHVLWHPALGGAPRYGTAPSAASMRALLSQADWKEQVADGLPPEFADDIPMDLFGQIAGLPAGTARVPWNGPAVRIVEHRGHAPGHAALLIEGSSVLIAGDMLSDVLVPMLDLSTKDPAGDYLDALQLLEDAARDARVVVPGHGSVGDADELHERILLDRAYVRALVDGMPPDDPRLTSPKPGWEWVSFIHEGQAESFPRARCQ